MSFPVGAKIAYRDAAGVSHSGVVRAVQPNGMYDLILDDGRRVRQPESNLVASARNNSGRRNPDDPYAKGKEVASSVRQAERTDAGRKARESAEQAQGVSDVRQIAIEEVSYKILKDPPRFSANKTRLCGNALDGNAYLLFLPKTTRKIERWLKWSDLGYVAVGSPSEAYFVPYNRKGIDSEFPPELGESNESRAKRIEQRKKVVETASGLLQLRLDPREMDKSLFAQLSPEKQEEIRKRPNRRVTLNSLLRFAPDVYSELRLKGRSIIKRIPLGMKESKGGRPASPWERDIAPTLTEAIKKWPEEEQESIGSIQFWQMRETPTEQKARARGMRSASLYAGGKYPAVAIHKGFLHESDAVLVKDDRTGVVTGFVVEGVVDVPNSAIEAFQPYKQSDYAKRENPYYSWLPEEPGQFSDYRDVGSLVVPPCTDLSVTDMTRAARTAVRAIKDFVRSAENIKYWLTKDNGDLTRKTTGGGPSTDLFAGSKLNSVFNSLAYNMSQIAKIATEMNSNTKKTYNGDYCVFFTQDETGTMCDVGPQDIEKVLLRKQETVIESREKEYSGYQGSKTLFNYKKGNFTSLVTYTRSYLDYLKTISTSKKNLGFSPVETAVSRGREGVVVGRYYRGNKHYLRELGDLLKNVLVLPDVIAPKMEPGKLQLPAGYGQARKGSSFATFEKLGDAKARASFKAVTHLAVFLSLIQNGLSFPAAMLMLKQTPWDGVFGLGASTYENNSPYFYDEARAKALYDKFKFEPNERDVDDEKILIDAIEKAAENLLHTFRGYYKNIGTTQDADLREARAFNAVENIIFFFVAREKNSIDLRGDQWDGSSIPELAPLLLCFLLFRLNEASGGLASNMMAMAAAERDVIAQQETMREVEKVLKIRRKDEEMSGVDIEKTPSVEPRRVFREVFPLSRKDEIKVEKELRERQTKEDRANVLRYPESSQALVSKAEAAIERAKEEAKQLRERLIELEHLCVLAAEGGIGIARTMSSDRVEGGVNVYYTYNPLLFAFAQAYFKIRRHEKADVFSSFFIKGEVAPQVVGLRMKIDRIGAYGSVMKLLRESAVLYQELVSDSKTPPQTIEELADGFSRYVHEWKFDPSKATQAPFWWADLTPIGGDSTQQKKIWFDLLKEMIKRTEDGDPDASAFSKAMSTIKGLALPGINMAGRIYETGLSEDFSETGPEGRQQKNVLSVPGNRLYITQKSSSRDQLEKAIQAVAPFLAGKEGEITFKEFKFERGKFAEQLLYVVNRLYAMGALSQFRDSVLPSEIRKSIARKLLGEMAAREDHLGIAVLREVERELASAYKSYARNSPKEKAFEEKKRVLQEKKDAYLNASDKSENAKEKVDFDRARAEYDRAKEEYDKVKSVLDNDKRNLVKVLDRAYIAFESNEDGRALIDAAVESDPSPDAQSVYEKLVSDINKGGLTKGDNGSLLLLTNALAAAAEKTVQRRSALKKKEDEGKSTVGRDKYYRLQEDPIALDVAKKALEQEAQGKGKISFATEGNELRNIEVMINAARSVIWPDGIPTEGLNNEYGVLSLGEGEAAKQKLLKVAEVLRALGAFSGKVYLPPNKPEGEEAKVNEQRFLQVKRDLSEGYLEKNVPNKGDAPSSLFWFVYALFVTRKAKDLPREEYSVKPLRVGISYGEVPKDTFYAVSQLRQKEARSAREVVDKEIKRLENLLAKRQSSESKASENPKIIHPARPELPPKKGPKNKHPVQAYFPPDNIYMFWLDKKQRKLATAFITSLPHFATLSKTEQVRYYDYFDQEYVKVFVGYVPASKPGKYVQHAFRAMPDTDYEIFVMHPDVAKDFQNYVEALYFLVDA